MSQGRRPAGRLFCLVLAVVVASGIRVSAGAEASGGKAEKPANSSAAKPAVSEALPHAASPAPQSGPTLTTVADTVYMADGTPAQGVLVITWPAFVDADGTEVAAGALDVTLGANGTFSVALAPNAVHKPGSDKKDAAMSFLQNALAMTDAVAAREIIDPDKFKDGISKIIDGTVECLNASTWCKQPTATGNQPSARCLSRPLRSNLPETFSPRP
ncbi:MAG: hypothetical protein WAM69_16445 [Candidatus Sulfotelmatobacter sp.]